MEQEQYSCLVCSHVIRDINSVGFICHLPDGWYAACSEECLDAHDVDEFGMIHLGHIHGAGHVPKAFISLPMCFAIDRKIDVWAARYYRVPYDPEEGDVVAVGPNFEPNDVVTVYKETDGSVLFVTLEEGTVCIPFWSTSETAEVFREYAKRGQTTARIEFKNLILEAQRTKIQFLLADFLSAKFDSAVLVERVMS